MMFTIRARRFWLSLCLALLAAGCSREQQDWRSAEGANTLESYGQFIQRHPESELARQARTRVTQLEEDRDWQHAGSVDTVVAYRQFMLQHPSGKWVQEARVRIENFSLGEQTQAPSPPPEPAAPPPPARLASAPDPAVAVPAPPLAASPNPTISHSVEGPGFGVQLGAFSSAANANSEWDKLTARFSTELLGLTSRVVAADTAAGRVFRLQAGVADEARARRLCDALKKQSQPCVPVLPR
jgi:cell division protein FtsN